MPNDYNYSISYNLKMNDFREGSRKMAWKDNAGNKGHPK